MMPKFTPAPESVVLIFDRAIADLHMVERRKMFGYPSAFFHGQMVCGVFADRIMLRLSEADRAEFLRLEGAKIFEVMPGRPMREYVELPPAVMNSPEALSGWLRRGLAYVETLPPKQKKASKAGKKGAKP
jgi:TfoX/Sxy family transcriptional regulator of competence genes